MQALRANGPIAITIWADSNPMLQFYKGGIYSHPDSPLAAEDHAITLVGWGEEKLLNGTPVPFWIIMNSWGNTWWVARACSLKLPPRPYCWVFFSFVVSESCSRFAGARRASCA